MSLKDLPFQAMGGQPAFEPNTLESFVSEPRIGNLAYLRRDGSPVQVPIWYKYQEGDFLILTATNSPKAKALGRNPRASLTIQDETPPYRAVIMDGEVSIAAVPATGGLITEMAMRYFGKFGGQEYEKMTAEESEKSGQSLLTFRPARVRGFDNHRLIGAPLRLYMRLRAALPIPANWL